MADYQGPRGAIFHNREKQAGSNQPDYTGDIEMDRDLVKMLVEQLNTGAQFAKVRLAGWGRQSDRAGDFISLKASEPKKKDGGAVQQPAGQSFAPQATSNDAIPF